MTEYKLSTNIAAYFKQNLTYSDFSASVLKNEIIVSDANLFPLQAGEDAFVFKAQTTQLDVSYTQFILRDFNVKQVMSQQAEVYIAYSKPSHSNIHQIIDDFQAYKHQDGVKQSSTWDVETLTVSDLRVHLDDAQLGFIGYFDFDKLNITNLSSALGSQENSNVILHAIFLKIKDALMTGSLQGQFDKQKLIVFLMREATGMATEKLSDAFSEAIKAWQQLKAKP